MARAEYVAFKSTCSWHCQTSSTPDRRLFNTTRLILCQLGMMWSELLSSQHAKQNTPREACQANHAATPVKQISNPVLQQYCAADIHD
jgi:hypothetical protein